MKKSNSIYKMCRIAIMAAILVAVKEVLAWLPNGELVTSIVCVGTLVFGWEMLISTIIFSLIEIMLYGFGMWTVVYFYIWEILVGRGRGGAGRGAASAVGLRGVHRLRRADCIC